MTFNQKFQLCHPAGSFVLVVLLVTFAALPGTVWGQQADRTGTGTIRGTVVYVPNPQRPWRLGRYYIRNAKSGEIAEAVVALNVRDLELPDADRAPQKVTIDQKNFQFVPETVAIRAGDRVRFLNSDEHLHNVKTNHPKLSFNVAMPAGTEHEEEFSVVGGIREPFVITCVFHSAMRAWLFVFDHPWFAVTGNDGAFELKDVPAGEYRLEVSHPAGGLRTRQIVQVVAGEETQVRLQLGNTKG